MSTNGRVQTRDVEGIVEATNATGLKLGGAWLNVSRFKPVELPEAGTHVRVQVDDRGYIRSLEVLDLPRESHPSLSWSGRDQVITRLAVLKAAARYAAYRPTIKSDDVLVLAEQWLEWVEQP